MSYACLKLSFEAGLFCCELEAFGCSAFFVFYRYSERLEVHVSLPCRESLCVEVSPIESLGLILSQHLARLDAAQYGISVFN